ncbi:nucleoside deaminase [Bacillus haimaensis]|uniref:nucleoside deaminase n=1 Tax=Bacillus haimaensis TaxID=3160967 RepID=UPI003AA89956
MNHQSFVLEAINLANENVKTGSGGPFGAILVKDGKVVGRGVNRVTGQLDPTAHAEVEAIRDACQNLKDFQLKDCILYTSCEPCPMCFGAIYWARIREVYFASSKHDAKAAGFDDAFIYKELLTDGSVKKIPFHHVQLETVENPFTLWKNAIMKIEY